MSNNLYQFLLIFFSWYWIPPNSTIFNTVEKIPMEIDTNYWADLMYSFWWNETNTVKIPDGWGQSGIWCTNLISDVTDILYGKLKGYMAPLTFLFHWGARDSENNPWKFGEVLTIHCWVMTPISWLMSGQIPWETWKRPFQRLFLMFFFCL